MAFKTQSQKTSKIPGLTSTTFFPDAHDWSAVFVRGSRVSENLRAVDKPLKSDKRVSPSSAIHGHERWRRSPRLAVLSRVINACSADFWRSCLLHFHYLEKTFIVGRVDLLDCSLGRENARKDKKTTQFCVNIWTTTLECDRERIASSLRRLFFQLHLKWTLLGNSSYNDKSLVASWPLITASIL